MKRPIGLLAVAFALWAAPAAAIQVSLVAPTQNVTVQTGGVSFQWQPVSGAEYYHFVVCRASSCSGSDLIAYEYLGSTSYGVSLSTGSYNWWVKAYSAEWAVVADWSSTGSFVVSTVPKAQLIAPAHGAAVSGLVPVQFSWQAVPGPATYDFVVCRPNSCDGSDLVYAGSVTGTSTSLSLEGGSYRWWIKGWQGSQMVADWSDTRNVWVDDFCAGQFALADFNGDGRTDRLCSTSGETRVSLATANGFAAATTWIYHGFSAPLTGDFDGDGKADVAEFNSGSGVFSVSRSNGSSLSTPASWGTASSGGSSCTGSAQPGTGDFNGDGITDVSCKVSGSDSVFIGLSQVPQSSYSFGFSIFGSATCDTTQRDGTLDMNGDGRDDWFCIGNSNGTFLVFPSTGSSFSSSVTAADSSFCAVADYVFGDFNGDGRTDLVCPTNGKVSLSTGNGYLYQGAFGGGCSGATNIFAADVDADGAAEVVCNNTGATTTDITVREWTGTTLASAETWIGSFCANTVRSGDFNGDGKPDLMCAYLNVVVAGTSGWRPDLLKVAANGIGGETEATYLFSSAITNTNNPGVKPVVSTLTTRDGRGGSSTSTFSYEGGLVNRPERQFMGFRKVRETKPCLAGESACPFVETLFMQDHVASVGKPESVRYEDGSGHVLRSQVFEYTTNGTTLPRTSLLTGTWSYEYSGTTSGCGSWPCSTGKRTYVTNQYDSYGNVTQTSSYGDYDTSGDETTAANSFVPNTSSYIVDRIAVAQLYSGVGTSGTKLQETRIHYDGNGYTQAPSAGYPTQTDRWLKSATEDRFVSSATSYDSYGNPTQVTDETSRSVTTAWDSTYHLFPISATNAVSESTTTEWDALCGVPTSTKSPNQQGTGLQTAFETDVLCRPTRTDFPLGGYEIKSYVNIGTASTQHVKVETPPGTGSSDHYVKSYFDGLGRTYKTEARSATSGVDIVVTQSFNARGGVASTSAPFYSNASPQSTTYSYDRWDRLVATVLPDSNQRTVSYGLWSTTTTDENGKSSTSRRNLSNPLQTLQERLLGSTTVTTASTYDVLGRLAAMEDHLGHDWSWTFDSLGRNLQKIDPDAGTWVFEYDDAGRLTSQTDAKSQETTFEHDDAGRLETKTNSAGTVTTAYSETRSTFYNVGMPTTITSPSSVLKLDYDAEGKAVKQTRTLDSTDYVLTRTYDSNGFLRGITYPDGDSVGTTSNPLTYDGAGRLYGVPNILTSVTYSALGQPLVQTNANGTATTKTYSAARGLLTNIDTLAGSTTIQDLHYTLDDVGMVTEVTSSVANEGWSYQYDDLYRLTQATNTSDSAQSQSWQYDETGRITNNSRVGSYSYPSVGQPRPHAPLTAGSHTFTNYDGNGNLVVGAGRTMSWDADNRITQATVGSTTTSFTYDAFGERVKKTTGANTTRYPMGDDYEIAPDGTVTKYVSVDTLGVVAKRVGPVATAQTFWHHTDRLGSINAITNVSGAEVFRKKYRPYGETLAESGSNTESRGWIDQRNDTETGLTYLHARYYDPMLGTFLSPDPIGVAGGLNLYGYGFGNPITNADRTGLTGDPCREKEDGYTPPECDGWEDDPWFWYPRGAPRRPSDRRYYWVDDLHPHWEPCGIRDDCWDDDDPRNRRTPPDDTTPTPTPPECPDCPPIYTPPCPDCTGTNPTGAGSPRPELNPFVGDNPNGVFDGPDPNDRLRRPASQSRFQFQDSRVYRFGEPMTCDTFWGPVLNRAQENSQIANFPFGGRAFPYTVPLWMLGRAAEYRLLVLGRVGAAGAMGYVNAATMGWTIGTVTGGGLEALGAYARCRVNSMHP